MTLTKRQKNKARAQVSNHAPVTKHFVSRVPSTWELMKANAHLLPYAIMFWVTCNMVMLCFYAHQANYAWLLNNSSVPHSNLSYYNNRGEWRTKLKYSEGDIVWLNRTEGGCAFFCNGPNRNEKPLFVKNKELTKLPSWEPVYCWDSAKTKPLDHVMTNLVVMSHVANFAQRRCDGQQVFFNVCWFKVFVRQFNNLLPAAHGTRYDFLRMMLSHNSTRHVPAEVSNEINAMFSNLPSRYIFPLIFLALGCPVLAVLFMSFILRAFMDQFVVFVYEFIALFGVLSPLVLRNCILAIAVYQFVFLLYIYTLMSIMYAVRTNPKQMLSWIPLPKFGVQSVLKSE